jgi:hypothetical protein
MEELRPKHFAGCAELKQGRKKQGSFDIEIKFVPTTILWALLSVLSQTQTKFIGFFFIKQINKTNCLGGLRLI